MYDELVELCLKMALNRPQNVIGQHVKMVSYVSKMA